MNGYASVTPRHSPHAHSGRSPRPWTPIRTGRGEVAPSGTETVASPKPPTGRRSLHGPPSGGSAAEVDGCASDDGADRGVDGVDEPEGAAPPARSGQPAVEATNKPSAIVALADMNWLRRMLCSLFSPAPPRTSQRRCRSGSQDAATERYDEVPLTGPGSGGSRLPVRASNPARQSSSWSSPKASGG